MADLDRVKRGKDNQMTGKGAERIAFALLADGGVRMLERIATPISIVGSRPGGWVRIVYGEKVSGDLRGITDNGRSVLVEVKRRAGEKLSWSAFEAHQPDRLSEHAALGGLSLLVWIHPGAHVVLEWPVPDFGPRKPLTLVRALQLQWAENRYVD